MFSPAQIHAVVLFCLFVLCHLLLCLFVSVCPLASFHDQVYAPLRRLDQRRCNTGLQGATLLSVCLSLRCLFLFPLLLSFSISFSVRFCLLLLIHAACSDICRRWQCNIGLQGAALLRVLAMRLTPVPLCVPLSLLCSCDYSRYMPSLRRLDLRRCNIGLQGATLLSEALANTKSLQTFLFVCVDISTDAESYLPLYRSFIFLFFFCLFFEQDWNRLAVGNGLILKSDRAHSLPPKNTALWAKVAALSADKFVWTGQNSWMRGHDHIEEENQ